MGLFLHYAEAMQQAITENKKQYDEWMQNISPMGARKDLEAKLVHSIIINGKGRFNPKLVRQFVDMELTYV